MAAFSPALKLRVVTLLACFKTPSQVQRILRADGGIEASLQQISLYDGATSKSLSRELRAVFQETRRRFLDEIESIPVAHQGYRLRRLQEILDDERLARDPNLAASLLQQAAREVGGSYTNRVNLNVRDLDAAIEAELARLASRGQTAVPGAAEAGE